MLQVQLPDVDPVEGDPATGDVPQPGHQCGEHGLARPGRADQGHGLPRRDVEVQPGQHGGVRGVREGEVHGLEAHVAAGRVDPAVATDDARLGVEDLQDARGGGHRLLGHREDDAERGDRPHQAEQQGDERDQLTGRQRAAAHAVRAEGQHDHDRDVGDDLEEGPEAGGEPDLLHARGVQPVGGSLVAGRDVLAAAEGLDDPDADGTLLGVRREVALLVLHPPGDHDVALLEAHREPHDRRRGGRDDQPERPVHVQQHHGRRRQLHDVDEQEQQAEAAEATDRREVGRRAREQLAGLPVAVEGHRQLLQPRVEVAAHRGLQAEHRGRLHPSAHPDQEGLGHAEQQRQAGQRPQGGEVTLGDRPVDDRAGHQRDADGQRHAAEGGDQHQRERPHVGPQVAAQPPQRVHTRCLRRVPRFRCHRQAA